MIKSLPRYVNGDNHTYNSATLFIITHILSSCVGQVIVPRPPHDNWSSLLKELRSKLSRPPALFMFRNVFFWLEWPNDPKYAAVEKVVRLNLTTLLKTRRQVYMERYSQRSKCIVVPRAILDMGVHEVNTYYDYEQMTAYVDASYGLLHHYRVDLGGGIDQPYQVDTRMWDFAQLIIDRTWHLHESILSTDRR